MTYVYVCAYLDIWTRFQGYYYSYYPYFLEVLLPLLGITIITIVLALMLKASWVKALGALGFPHAKFGGAAQEAVRLFRVTV